MRFVEGRRWILAAALIGLVARLAFSFVYWIDKPLTHDEREYLALASSLEAGRGFTYPVDHEVGTSQRFGRAPGYPAFRLSSVSARFTSPLRPASRSFKRFSAPSWSGCLAR
jgi:hypothetical protein